MHTVYIYHASNTCYLSVFNSCTKIMREKNDVLSTNKQSNKLLTAVSVAFSYLLQCRVKTGGKMLLFIVFQTDSTDGGGAKG